MGRIVFPCVMTLAFALHATSPAFGQAADGHLHDVNPILVLGNPTCAALYGLQEFKVCVGYELHGRGNDILPLDADEIVACKPVYETFAGWTESTVGLTQWDQLPKNARAYLQRVQALIGAPIDMVSTGPDRDHTILLRHPYKA